MSRHVEQLEPNKQKAETASKLLTVDFSNDYNAALSKMHEPSLKSAQGVLNEKFGTPHIEGLDDGKKLAAETQSGMGEKSLPQKKDPDIADDVASGKWTQEGNDAWYKILDKSAGENNDNGKVLKGLNEQAKLYGKNADGSPRVSVGAKETKDGEMHFFVAMNQNKSEYQRNMKDGQAGKETDRVMDIGFTEGGSGTKQAGRDTNHRQT